jgi:single-strand DNA-binding protein
MRGVNKVILVGTVGKDPEAFDLNNGNTLVKFSMATSEQWKDKNTGEKKENTEWHRISIFGKLAEIAELYVKKGSKLYIEGKLKTSSYEQDGVKKYTTEIVADSMQMLDGKPSQENTGSGNSSQGAAKGHRAPPLTDDGFSDDIPFN